MNSCERIPRRLCRWVSEQRNKEVLDGIACPTVRRGFPAALRRGVSIIMTCLPESLDAVVVTYSRTFAGGNEIAMDSQRIVRGDLHGSSDTGSFFRNKRAIYLK